MILRLYWCRLAHKWFLCAAFTAEQVYNLALFLPDSWDAASLFYRIIFRLFGGDLVIDAAEEWELSANPKLHTRGF